METGLYFSVQVGELPGSTFDVVEFNLDEALSGLFTLTLTLSSTHADINLTEQLLKKVTFTVFSDGQKQRIVNGIVASASRGDSGFKRTFYTVIVRPSLWQLTLTKDSRIYHFKSVPQIIDEILQDFAIRFDKQLMDAHESREYTVLKRESYFDFIYRLMAEEGISFWFEEDKLFYSDSRLGMTMGSELLYNAHPQSGAKESVISQLTFGAHMRPTEVKVKDYRYSHPSVALDAKSKTAKSLPAFSVYDSYGRYQDEAISKQFSQYRLEALQAESEAGEAVSNCIGLMPGKLFEMSEHPSASMNGRWQVVRIQHHGTLPQSLDNESDDSAAGLTNRFTFIPAKVEWRPPFVHKPQTDGDETATVVGPKGEEIYVNEDGAVKVHFHWNTYDEQDENASCWVRVMQNWNGDGFGFLATPRIGQEVIISYLNGDIDRPIVVGTVYNGYNRPPVKLPESKTQMSIRSKTHKGEGFNELRFEDENGKQEVFIHAQKDMNTKVLNDQTTEVLNNSFLLVKNEHSETIDSHRYQHQKADEHHLTEQNRNTQIKGSDYKTVVREEHTSVGTVKTTQAGTEIHLKSGVQAVINGGLSLTLQASGHHIILNPAGIWLSSPAKIGGAPMSGTPASPALPMSKSTTLVASAPPLSPVQVETFKKDAPFCLECMLNSLGVCTSCTTDDIPAGNPSEAKALSLTGFSLTNGINGGDMTTGIIPDNPMSGFMPMQGGLDIPDLASVKTQASALLSDNPLMNKASELGVDMNTLQNIAANPKQALTAQAKDKLTEQAGQFIAGNEQLANAAKTAQQTLDMADNAKATAELAKTAATDRITKTVATNKPPVGFVSDFNPNKGGKV